MKPPVTSEDLYRLLIEQRDDRDDSWFEHNGFDDSVEQVLVVSGRDGFPELMMQAVQEGDDHDPALLFGNICATFMVAGFKLGWITRQQFGGRDG